VGGCDVGDVHEVADAGPVRGGVVGAEDEWYLRIASSRSLPERRCRCRSRRSAVSRARPHHTPHTDAITTQVISAHAHHGMSRTILGTMPFR
jgi:hypothetical protein